MMRAMAVMTLVVCAVMAASAASVQAGSSGLLVQSDAPPGFGKLHTKVYTTWVKKMTVKTRTKGMGKGTMSCKALPGSRKDGWVSGMIQAFDSPGLLDDFEICESVFSAVAGAQQAYAAASAQLTQQAAKVSGIKPMQGATVGDASHGVAGTQGGFGADELVFRHGPAVVVMVYLGTTTFSESDFLATADRANSRIP